jgi:hypothetical protein
MPIETNLLNRRQWLLFAAGLAGTAALSQTLPKPAQAAQPMMEQWPWPYVKLDPTTTAELAYREWYRVFCGCAVISSVFRQLREKVGEPYTSFPIDAFVFLEGGMASWGTICGSNAGANIVANLIIGPRTAGAAEGHLIGSDIMEWYSNTALPLYQPKEPKISGPIVQTISESPLCHVSVGKWMAVADHSLRSPERRDRCARVTASVAYHLVELLNQWHEEEYDSEGEWAPVSEYGINAQPNCSQCHSTGIPQAPKDQTE